MEDLKMELLIIKDIHYLVSNAATDLQVGFKEGAHYRLSRAHDFCIHLQNYLADAVGKTNLKRGDV